MNEALERLLREKEEVVKNILTRHSVVGYGTISMTDGGRDLIKTMDIGDMFIRQRPHSTTAMIVSHPLLMFMRQFRRFEHAYKAMPNKHETVGVEGQYKNVPILCDRLIPQEKKLWQKIDDNTVLVLECTQLEHEQLCRRN
jgi:hypothetical protein